MLESHHRHFSLTNPPHCASEATYAIRHHHILFNLILLLPCHSAVVFSSGIPSSLFTVDCYMILRPRMRNERSRPTLRHLRPGGVRRSRKNGKSSWLAGCLCNGAILWKYMCSYVHLKYLLFTMLLLLYSSVGRRSGRVVRC